MAQITATITVGDLDKLDNAQRPESSNDDLESLVSNAQPKHGDL